MIDAGAWEKAKVRHKRILGQIEGTGPIIDEKHYSMDILQQITSMRSVLDNLGVELLAEHMNTVLVRCEEHVAEIQAAFSRFLR